MNEVFVLLSDLRQKALADELINRGIGTDHGERLTDGYSVVILPYVSFSGEYLNSGDKSIHYSQVMLHLRRTMVIFAGMFPEQFKRECEEKGVRLIDWFGDEELTVKNAYLTAEGALGIAIDRSPRAVKDSLVTIIGYGRVAKACARMFDLMGAHVRIMARNYAARIDAYTHGYKSYEIENDAPLSDADIIINTVPSMILDGERMARVNKNAIMIELASKPYGIDKSAAETLGIPLYIAPGLPAKVAPLTAGRLMADMAMKYLKGGVADG